MKTFYLYNINTGKCSETKAARLQLAQDIAKGIFAYATKEGRSLAIQHFNSKVVQ